MSTDMHACNCIGPQAGQPLCPCMMRSVAVKNGRWVEPKRDLGPVVEPSVTWPPASIGARGCVCPPGSEKTCRGPLCPRQPIGSAQ